MWSTILGLLLMVVKFAIGRSVATIEAKKAFHAFVLKAQAEGLIGRKIYHSDREQDEDIERQKREP